MSRSAESPLCPQPQGRTYGYLGSGHLFND